MKVGSGFLGMVLVLSSWLNAENNYQNIDYLLEKYKLESDLSKITKSESNGFVDIFTRDDIERMQAKTLFDILKLFTIPFISRTNINSTMFIKPSQKSMPMMGVRIFINDHDISASVYQSGALICGSITLDNIDHIEVYRSSASVEFGNETSSVIIKLYTKEPSREEGGKIRISGDDKGSSYLSVYQGKTIDKDREYFFYANTNKINREEYYNKGYPLKSDSSNSNIYANYDYNRWTFEYGRFQSESDPFLGLGTQATPSGGDIDTTYNYLHITKILENDLRIQSSVDIIDSSQYFQDKNGIYAGNYGFVQNYLLNTTDKIVSLIFDKTFKYNKNSLYIGGFYKHKHAEVEGNFDTKSLSFKTHYNLYSIYLEDKYNFSPTMMGIVSLKGDYYRYSSSEIEDKNKYIFRLGAIKNINKFQIKAFFTKTYYAAPLISLYSDDKNVPYKTNSSLKFSQPTLHSFGIRYKEKKNIANFRISYIKLTYPIAYDPALGFINKDKTFYVQYEASYTHKFDIKNRITLDVYHGRRKDMMEYSPPYGGHIVLHNSYKKFDFFNMLEYRASYSDYNVNVDASYDWTLGVRYHYSKDLLFGIKGENILNKGYRQIYKGLNFPISINDRKIWFNMEYQF